MRIDAERDRGISVAELARDEHRIAPLPDQDAGERVAKAVAGDPFDPAALARRLEASRGEVAMAQRSSGSGRKDKVVIGRVRGGKPMPFELFGEPRHEDYVATRGVGLESTALAVAAHLVAN